MNDTRPGSAYPTFLASMELTESDWRDGIGYNIEAIAEMTDDERNAAVLAVLVHLGTYPDWRDVEALGAIGTPAARATLRLASMHRDLKTRMRAAEELAGLGETVDLEGAIIDGLHAEDASDGLTKALEMAKQSASPRIQEALLERALHGNRSQRIHCAAMALYLGGKADEPFDWNHRPFFLKFGKEDRPVQLEAYRELCQRLGVADHSDHSAPER